MVGQWFHQAADFATTWLPLAFFVVIGLTAWLLWKTAGMMPRVKPANMVTGARTTTSWADVAGVEEVRGELMEVVEFMREPKRFERLGAKVPKGILLYGPPGTGKTLLAKAVAHESGANFYSASRLLVRGDVRGPRRGAHPQALQRGAQERARDRLHRRARRRRRDAQRPRLQPRAGPDPEPAPRRARRLRERAPGRRHGRLEPDPGSRSRAVAARPLRPVDARPAAGSRRPRGDPQGAHARQAAQPRRHRPRASRSADGRTDRRRAREHLQRGGHQGRPSQRVGRSRSRTSTGRSNVSSPACSSARC